MTLPQDLVDMGYIATAFGIQGWVKIKVATEYSDSLADYASIYLRFPDGRVLTKTIENSFVRDGIFHAKLTGVNDRDAAFALKGATVAVDRALFPELEEDEYYWVDLIGLTVINQQSETLGEVTDLMETGANDVLVVYDGKQERLIPFIAQYVLKVDLDSRQINVDWGMDY